MQKELISFELGRLAPKVQKGVKRVELNRGELVIEFTDKIKAGKWLNKNFKYINGSELIGKSNIANVIFMVKISPAFPGENFFVVKVRAFKL